MDRNDNIFANTENYSIVLTVYNEIYTTAHSYVPVAIFKGDGKNTTDTVFTVETRLKTGK